MTIPNLSPLAPQKKSMMTGEDPHFPFWILTHMRLYIYIYILLLPIYIHWWLRYVKISKWLLIQPDFSAFSARTFQAVPCFPALAEVPMWFSTEITEQQTHGVDEQDQASTRKRDSKHQKMGIESFKLIEPSKKKIQKHLWPSKDGTQVEAMTMGTTCGAWLRKRFQVTFEVIDETYTDVGLLLSFQFPQTDVFFLNIS